jgi:cyclophilin family peptidyl-prolyl cis-trans isomerase
VTVANYPTGQADETPSQTETRPQRGPIEPEPEPGPSIRPGSLSRTLGHVALTVLAVLVLWTAYQHSRRDDDDERDGRAEASEGTTETSAGDAAVSTTLAEPSAAVAPTCPPEEGSNDPVLAFESRPPMCVDPSQTYIATVVTSRGEFTIELHTADAPQTVNNFVFLARWGFYQGAAFHRIVPNFVMDTGDPVGPRGTGTPGYELVTEPPPTSDPPYPPLSVTTVQSAQGVTHGSQFAIVLGAQGESGPRPVTRFGEVTSGESTIREIEATGTHPDGDPSTDTVIERITIAEQ